jgi:hypothetical protein
LFGAKNNVFGFVGIGSHLVRFKPYGNLIDFVVHLSNKIVKIFIGFQATCIVGKH